MRFCFAVRCSQQLFQVRVWSCSLIKQGYLETDLPGLAIIGTERYDCVCVSVSRFENL